MNYTDDLLLKLAYETLYNALNCYQENSSSGNEYDDELLEKRGIFVTLYKNSKLRGCIGNLEQQFSILDGVKKYTLLSAFNDHSFPTVTKDELKDIKIEISILSKPRQIKSYEEISFGSDGVIIEDENNNKGVFLPEVSMHFQNLDDFMEELCEQKLHRERKFYLSKDAKIFVFQSRKISN